MSPSRAPVAVAPREPKFPPAIEPFPYDSIPSAAYARTTIVERSRLGEPIPDDSIDDASDVAARETRARAQGRQEGLAEASKIFDEQLARERATLASALSGFTRDRTDYFLKVEGEVVQLALSIARKILHREAQLDPLLLAGIVRVALEKIDGATGVVLRIHPENAAEWRRYLAAQLDPAVRPEILEDPVQSPDRCTLETSMGTATIGVEVQLKEIEQGLMDLLAARPDAANTGAVNAAANPALANRALANRALANSGAAS